MNQDNLKMMVDPQSARGQRRRQILKCIFENPGLSQMEITKIVYGKEKALNSYKSLRTHLKNFADKGLIEIKNGKPRKVFLTEKGEDFCKVENIEFLSREAKEFIRVLNTWVLTAPLTNNDETRLQRVLNDDVLQFLFAVGENPLEIPDDLRRKYHKIKPKVDVWRCLRGLVRYDFDKRKVPSKKLKDLPAFKDSFFHKPISVLLAESSGLQHMLKDLAAILLELVFKNPRLSELIDHIRSAEEEGKRKRG